MNFFSQIFLQNFFTIIFLKEFLQKYFFTQFFLKHNFLQVMEDTFHFEKKTTFKIITCLILLNITKKLKGANKNGFQISS